MGNEILPFINRRQEFLENIFFEKLFKNHNHGPTLGL